ncbi:MAG: EAL domain-containing protein [Proteobacteria bacterium]|nr:EAL domain-containing protein [Pseudomonadota bacterium]
MRVFSTAVTSRIGLVLLFPFIGIVITIVMLFSHLHNSADDAVAINVAGRQRMLSQQIQYYALRTRLGNKADQVVLDSIVETFDNSLKALEFGGEAMGRTLPPASDEVFYDLVIVKSLWRQYREQLQSISDIPSDSPRYHEVLTQLEDNAVLLIAASDNVVSAMEARNTDIEEQMMGTLGLVAAVDVLLFITAFWFMRNFIRSRRQHENALREQAQLVDQIHDSVVATDMSGTITKWNKGAKKLFGYDADEVIGLNLNLVYPSQDGDFFNNEIFQPLQKVERLDMKVQSTRKTGDDFIAHSSVSPLYGVDGKQKGIIFYSMDITEQQHAEEAIKKSEKEWRNTFDSISDFVSLHGNDYRIIKANRRLADYFNVEPDDLVGRYCFELFGCGDKPSVNCPHIKTVRIRQPVTDEIECTGVDVPLLVTTSPVIDENGEYVATVHIAKDITEQKNAEKQLIQLAHFDHLTELPNRELFFDRLRQAILRTSWSDRLISVLFVDLDRFKTVNDAMGHEMGDLLLQEAAVRLQACLREGDTVARIGGDEFAILLVDVAGKSDIPVMAKSIIKSMRKPFEINGRELFVTASIGISICPEDGTDAEQLLSRADISMYHAKELGRNNYQFYTSAMDMLTPERIAMENKLRQALERNEFQLYYQPKVCLQTGTITGVEALLRWFPENEGVVPPSVFIPILEDTGLIIPVGKWVLEQACKQNRVWQQAGLPMVRIAINLSVRQFRDHNLVGFVDSAIKESVLDPSCIELEITESILMDDTDETRDTLNTFSKMGIHIAIDDFGTGYSSLGYLKQFPVNTLKIDRSFVRDIPSNNDDAILAQTIIVMAHSLGLRVVAEGVETSEQSSFLRDSDCDEVQGYLFSRPVDVGAFTDLLQENSFALMDREA